VLQSQQTELVLQELRVPGSSVAEVVIVAGAEVAPVAVAVVEDRKTSVGTMASEPAVDGSVDNWGCLHKPMDHRQLLEELVAVVCVDLPGNHYLMTSRSVVDSRCYYGHRQVEQSCS
jgi:hypothetical protein